MQIIKKDLEHGFSIFKWKSEETEYCYYGKVNRVIQTYDSTGLDLSSFPNGVILVLEKENKFVEVHLSKLDYETATALFFDKNVKIVFTEDDQKYRGVGLESIAIE
jgi:hypothetical protein